MKAVLEFTLPEEEIEHQNAVDAGKAFSLIHHIAERIRGRLKYGPSQDETDFTILEELESDILEAFPNFYER